MKSLRSSLAPRYSVAFILCLSCVMILMASALSVAPNSSLGASSLGSSVRADAAAAPTAGEARSLASLPLVPAGTPNITATKTDSPGTAANPGDTITYTVVISNATGTADATGVNFTDTIDPNTTLVPGSLKVSPIAVNDTYQTIGNVNISVPSGSGLVANDLNPGGMGTLGFTLINATPFVSGSAVATTHGSVIVNTDGSFTYNPTAGFPGPTDSFTYTLGNGTGLTDTATVTINIAGLIWFVDNTPGANGDGRLSSPFRTFVGGANPLTGTVINDAIFIYTGSGNYTGGKTLTSGEKLIGQGAGDSLLSITGFSTPSGTNLLPSTGGTNPTIAAAADSITLASGNTVRGVTLNVTAVGATALTGSSFGTLTLAETAIGGTNGRALSLTTGTLSGPVSSTAAFTSISSTNSSLTGITLTTVAGNMSSGSTTITTSSGAGISVNTSSAALSFNSTTAVTNSGGAAVNLATNTGTLTFATLNITNTTSNQPGLNAVDNTNTITTTSGAINTGSGTAVTITKSSGTTPLAVSLTSVSANGASRGILLSNTSGSFTVTGSGTANSGGTIQNMTGADDSGTTPVGTAIALNNATNVSLTRMHLSNQSNYSIRGTNVTGFGLDNSLIDGTNGSDNNVSASTPFNEGSINFDNLAGSATISNTNISGGISNNVRVDNTSATLNRITFTSDTIGTNSITNGNKGIGLESENTGVILATVQSTTFTASEGDLFGFNINATSGAADDLIFNNNTLSNNHPAIATGGGGVSILSNGTKDFTFHIASNTFRDAVGSAVLLVKSTGAASFSGTFATNTIGVAAIANSGSKEGDGLKIQSAGGGTVTVNITTNNQIHQYNNFGIDLLTGGGATPQSGTFNATITGNTIDTPGNTAGSLGIAKNGIMLNGGTVVGDTYSICASISGNSLATSGADAVPPVGGGQDIRVRQRQSTTVRLPGYAGSATDDTAVANFLIANNPTGGPTAIASHSVGFSGGAACTLASTSIGVVKTASSGAVSDAQVDAGQQTDELRSTRGQGSHDENIQKLKQEELNWMVQAAIRRWAETSISAEDLVRLQAATFEIANLPEGQIASADSSHIKIDETAAGYGWFFDQTPNEDSEFDVPVPGRELQTTEYSPAHGKMDLLTVVMRELGAVYLHGNQKISKRVRKTLQPLMESTLSPSVRRLPDLSLVQLPEPGSFGTQSQDATGASGAASQTPASASTGRKAGKVGTASKFTQQSGETVTQALGTIPVGEQVTLTFQVTVNLKGALPPGLSQVCNQGSVTGNFTTVLTDDPAVGGATDPTCTPLVNANLSVTKAAGSGTTCSTSNIVYTINYNNAGPNAAANVVVSDPMPVGTSLVSAPAPANWSRTDSVIVGGNGTLMFTRTGSSPTPDPATFTVTVSVDGTVADGAVLSNTASVTTDTYDPNLTNNTSSPATTVTVKKPPTTATVGGPQTICALGTTTGLGGNTPTIGTGTWTVQSGGTGTFNPSATTPGATFTHLTGVGPVVVRWTISNAPCADSFAEVTVTIRATPTATVGGPQTICALGTTTGLGGNTPTPPATGLWTIVTGGVTGTFSPGATSPNATFTHTGGAIGSTATLRWTVSNAPCTDATADVVITIKSQPTATVGGPQTICATGTTAGLGGNTPAAGETGTWSIVTGGVAGTFNPNANAPNATFTHTSGPGPFTLRWTVSNAPCTAATADVVITLLPAPIATAGGPQTICESGTTASLGGNTPAGGETGTWSIVTALATGTFNPNATTPGATFTPTSGPGTITVRWTVTNPTCGQSATADVIITVKQQPTATAGGPQTICALGTTASLGGNTPAGGATGTWSIVTGGATGSFSPSVNSPSATFTHATGAGPITLRWTVTNAPCTAATADVVITITQPPTTATVGGPQTICDASTTASLGGNAPTTGTGLWTIQTGGATGTFNPNATTPGATFTPTSGPGTIVVRWTISNAPCPASFAEVTVTVKLQPTATAGGPQTICALSTTSSLGGNTPAGGATGTWTVQSGGTGTFNPNANTPGATFTHATGAGPITLRWTVSNAPCVDATADVVITITQSPTTATVGGPQTICALSTTASLGGSTPVSGTGTWTVQSGGAGTFNPNTNTPGATFTHTSGTGPIVLRWTIASAPCPNSFAEVTITITQPPTSATVGGPQTICDASTTASLGGNAPTTGTGLWTIQTGGATGTFNPNATTPGATFTPTSGPGTIVVRWTISNAPCPASFAEVTVTVKQQPTATTGGNQNICAGSTSASLGGNTPAGGATGTWTIVTGGATGTFNPNANTPGATFTHTGGAGPITLRWTVSNPPCTNATADVVLTITQPPTTATAGGGQTIAPGGTTAGLGGNTPTTGTGSWSIVTGGVTGTFNPNATTPNATWTHVTGSGLVVLRWSISNAPCPASTADVAIQIGVAPVITCPASPVVVSATTGQCQAAVSFTVTATGIPAATVMCTPPSGSTFPVGSTTVNCTATNGVLPNAMCSFTVKVNDTQPPVFTGGCPAGINTAAPATCPFTSSGVVTYATPAATDNCPGVTVACNPPSGATFPVGTTTVTCTATDASNNTAQCTFPVTVASLCVQDDSNPGNVVLVNVNTGGYRFCCNGVLVATATTATVSVRGCVVTISDTSNNRYVLISIDGAGNKGTASIRVGSTMVCTITDRKLTNNTCVCN